MKAIPAGDVRFHSFFAQGGEFSITNPICGIGELTLTVGWRHLEVVCVIATTVVGLRRLTHGNGSSKALSALGLVIMF